jgi:hypothetical protein
MTSSIGIGDADGIALTAKWRRPHYVAVTGGLIIGNRSQVCASVAVRVPALLSRRLR